MVTGWSSALSGPDFFRMCRTQHVEDALEFVETLLECAYDGRIELVAAPLEDDLSCDIHAQGILVTAHRGERVEHVGDRDDPR